MFSGLVGNPLVLVGQSFQEGCQSHWVLMLGLLFEFFVHSLLHLIFLSRSREWPFTEKAEDETKHLDDKKLDCSYSGLPPVSFEAAKKFWCSDLF
jgi:hypothetical protein